MGSGLWFVLLLFLLVVIPLFLVAIVVGNRATRSDADAEFEELRARVEKLEEREAQREAEREAEREADERD